MGVSVFFLLSVLGDGVWAKAMVLFGVGGRLGLGCWVRAGDLALGGSADSLALDESPVIWANVLIRRPLYMLSPPPEERPVETTPLAGETALGFGFEAKAEPGAGEFSPMMLPSIWEKLLMRLCAREGAASTSCLCTSWKLTACCFCC